MENDTVISAENLGKSYLIRHQVGVHGYRRLSEELVDAVACPFRALARMRKSGDRGAEAAPPPKERFWALKNVSFQVKRGEVLGIIGKNGAGKSTLLKVLSRITEPTEGRVRIRGRVASLLEVGTGFHPELTGRENIFLNGTILGMTRREIQRKFDEIVAFAEIEKFLDTPVKRYSSGMYVRLAFAVAAHLEPEILIVDEVLAVGDVQFQKKCLGKMQDVAGHGRTVLLVSHNMGVIQRLTKTCLWMDAGKVAAYGDAGEVIEKYLASGYSHEGAGVDARNVKRGDESLGKDIRFSHVRFSKGGAPIFDFTDPPSLEIEIQLKRIPQELRVSLTIMTIDGTPVGSCYSAAIQPASTGGTRCRLALPPISLSPGHFQFSMALISGTFEGGYKVHDVLHRILAFESIGPAGDVDGTMAAWNVSWGRIRFPQAGLAIVT